MHNDYNSSITVTTMTKIKKHEIHSHAEKVKCVNLDCNHEVPKVTNNFRVTL